MIMTLSSRRAERLPAWRDENVMIIERVGYGRAGGTAGVRRENQLS
jgi:hypothetical protein